MKNILRLFFSIFGLIGYIIMVAGISGGFYVLSHLLFKTAETAVYAYPLRILSIAAAFIGIVTILCIFGIFVTNLPYKILNPYFIRRNIVNLNNILIVVRNYSNKNLRTLKTGLLNLLITGRIPINVE